MRRPGTPVLAGTMGPSRIRPETDLHLHSNLQAVAGVQTLGVRLEPTFCPSKRVLYEVLDSVSAAEDSLDHIPSVQNVSNSNCRTQISLPSRSMRPRRILVEDIGRLSSAIIRSIGSIMSGFNPLALLLAFISYAVSSVRRLTIRA